MQSLEQANETQNKLTTVRLDGIEINLKRLDSLDEKLSGVSAAIAKSVLTQADFAATQARLEGNMASMKADTAANIEEMGITLLTSMEKQSHFMATNMDDVRAQMQQMAGLMAKFTRRLSEQTSSAPQSPQKKKQRSFDDLNPPLRLTALPENDDMDTDEPGDDATRPPSPGLPPTNLVGAFDHSSSAHSTPPPTTQPTSLPLDPSQQSTTAPPNPQYKNQTDLAGAQDT